MTCAELRDLWTDGAEGAVRGDVHAAIERHVAACAACSEFRRSFERTPAVIREQTDTVMPSEARERLQRFLASRTRRG